MFLYFFHMFFNSERNDQISNKRRIRGRLLFERQCLLEEKIKHIYMARFINVECVKSMSHIKVNFYAIGFSNNFSELGIGNTR